MSLHGDALRARVLEALDATEQLLHIGHITGQWARDHNKKAVDPWDESACEWCLEGGILAATHFLEEGDEIANYCVATIQAANKEFVSSIRKADHHSKGAQHPSFNTGSGSKIHPASAIPTHNDSTTSAQVFKWIRKAKELARIAQWN